MPQSLRAAEFFDEFAERFDTFYEGRRNRFMQWFDRRFRSDMYIRFQRTFEQFGDLRGKTVVDIGCGSGVYVIEALRRGAARVVAIDPAAAMLALLRRRLETAGLSQRCELIQGAFPDVLPPVCDYAIVMGVMDYVAEPAAFLAALRSVTAILAAVSFPSRHWLRTPLRRLRYWLRRCPVYFYQETQIRALAQQAGFSVCQVHKIPGAGLDFHVCLRP